MKIVDLKCAEIGDNPVLRIGTDEGVDSYGEIESYKPNLTWHVLHLNPALIGEDPTNVEQVKRKIRQRGGFTLGVAPSAPSRWGALGPGREAAGLPVFKLSGGKVCDRERIYNGAFRFPLNSYDPADSDEAVPRSLRPRSAHREGSQARCGAARKDVLGDEVDRALDCGPGWTLPDATRLSKAVEHLHAF